MERKSFLFSFFLHTCALLLAIVILAPVVWLFIMSISPAGDLTAKPLVWWPQSVDFSRYGVLLSSVENSAGRGLCRIAGQQHPGCRDGDDRGSGAGHSRRMGGCRARRRSAGRSIW